MAHYIKNNNSIKGGDYMLEKKPVMGEEVKPEVKGYSCQDDCTEYQGNTSIAVSTCSVVKTCKVTCMW